ncbi:DUF1592 domain-containing protein [Rubripirellula reticaptiva]|uniref:Planctomycete cytochrome C n=1 Tax=Rubripirellula reticaptiva TaxID=2528013 RepID=A0A5C6F9S7_9BACT|nr:DUF1592 domain-containing protein [Rubripirellula reticaptiva]TWU57632.1 Planctomycete cytochrome C [Rubripirellula reticaptiva]
MVNTKNFIVAFVVATLVAAGAVDATADTPALMPEKHLSMFKEHCFECHDGATKEANIDLENLSFDVSKDLATAGLWQKVLGSINSGEMPPEDVEPLGDSVKADFLEDLSQRMVTARQILSDSGGAITLRRLNRREYANTIESLLGVRPDVTTLPDDQATSGFDTVGSSLFFSSDQLEQYLATARATLELALTSKSPIKSKTVRIEPEVEYNPHYAAAAAAMRDIAARSNAFLSQSEKPASDFGLLDEYQARKQRTAEWLPQLEQYLARPETKSGITLIMTIKQGGMTKVKMPVLHENADGKYVIRLRAAMYPDAGERFHYLEFTSGYGTGRKLLGWRKVTAPLNRPEIIEFPIEHSPGQKQQVWIHQRSHQDRGDKNLATLDMRANGIGTPPGIWIDWAELIGPDPVPSRANHSASELLEKVELVTDAKLAKQFLHRFATLAFRGEEPAPEFINRLVDQYLGSLSKGESSVDALIGPMAVVLASPSFMYMVESTGDTSSPRLTGAELAVRLAYMLWSSPPDDQLQALARSGELLNPSVLKQQTARLLADDRADEFVRGFVFQWLQMERLDMFQFDGGDFPTFDNAVRANAREEIFETVHLMLKEKLPLGTLLKSDFVVVNDLMAGYYGISNVQGYHFRKVLVPSDSLRGGLLGTAAVLAMGSDGQRASAVERGAWVLRHLLNDPPPPAPPNVPQLSRLAGEVLSARELARAHQEQPQCTNCHRKIDPLGFGLENFNAAGLWRDKEIIGTGRQKAGKWQIEKVFDIDPSGRLPDGETFADYFAMRDAVARHTDDFAQGFTESLITYGLGRTYGFADHDLAKTIIDAAKPNNYQLSDFIDALVQSPTFQTK